MDWGSVAIPYYTQLSRWFRQCLVLFPIEGVCRWIQGLLGERSVFRKRAGHNPVWTVPAFSADRHPSWNVMFGCAIQAVAAKHVLMFCNMRQLVRIFWHKVWKVSAAAWIGQDCTGSYWWTGVLVRCMHKWVTVRVQPSRVNFPLHNVGVELPPFCWIVWVDHLSVGDTLLLRAVRLQEGRIVVHRSWTKIACRCS